jgi:RNA polymerase sigma-32 factor
VTEDEVVSMNRRMSGGGDASLNAPIGGASGEGDSEWMDWLADDQTEGTQETRLAENEEFGARMTLLQEAMSELNDRERHIIEERRLKDEPATLEELSVQYGVSRERVRQIEVRAFEKLQKAMRKRAGERGLVAEATA